MIGPNFEKFKEAQDLVQLNGCTVTDDQKTLNKLLTELKENEASAVKKRGNASKNYIESSIGATETISSYVATVL